MKWYWSNYLERDELPNFADLWQGMGMIGTFVWFFFLLVGAACFFIGIFFLNQLPDSPSTYIAICALLGSAAFGMFACIFGGMAVSAIAHSTQRRLMQLEARLAKLEPTEIHLK